MEASDTATIPREEEEAQPQTQQGPDPRDEEIAQLKRELAAQSRQPGRDPNEKDRPWNVAQEHVGEENTREVAPLPYRGPGAVTHHFPHLTGGSGGPQVAPYVRALAELLAELGYGHNSVIRGESQHFDDTVMSDVRRFQLDHDVREPVAAYQGHPHPAEEVVRNLVGPYTIQAILEKAAEKRGVDVANLIGSVEYEVARQQR